MRQYAEILIDLVSDAVDRPFHYRILPHLQGKVQPGCMVAVPFGNKRYRGFVLRLLKAPEVAAVKDIAALETAEPLLNHEQLALIAWLSHRYFCRKIEALHALVPALLRQGRRPARLQVFALAPCIEPEDFNRAPAQRRAVEILKTRGPLPRSELARLGVKSHVFRVLEEKGIIRAVDEVALAKRESVAAVTPTEPLPLKESQQHCYDRLIAALDSRRCSKLLLHGITGSGKTEIYLQGIAHCLAQGRSALVMVPEIALTPQMIELFQGRFPGRTAVLHSRLTPSEKSRQWLRICSGEADVVLGVRSAGFAPLKKPGLIVLDEEHDHSYKQEDAPRYHAREVAWWRARYHGAVLVLGSATPSLESYYEVEQGKAGLLRMETRVTPYQRPAVQVVDMRQELKQGHRRIFSRPLLEELNRVLERDEQALLFLNRRGFASFVLCRECGFVVRCPSCAVSLTLHLDQDHMVCHYCSHESPVPQTCPSCGGIRIRYFGAGTQRVENEVKELYPGVALIRMDSDTTSTRGAHQRLYRQFREGKAKILIGTQMIAKGFDFPKVTLVGVITADTTLNLPDFRAAERTFQLLTQVAGRAGRGSRPGKVIIQTYHPDHYSIKTAAEQDYEAFYRLELENRRQLGYPPFNDLIRFLFTGTEESAVWEAAASFTRLLEPLRGQVELLGPAPAPLQRLKTYYRVQTILKGKKLGALAPRLRNEARAFRMTKTETPVRLAVDFNPQVVL
ncbi:MAG TPA: primosomal protein N' [Bacillota bacterium]|nr:primosomal protein N' [Bacillota bacterium]